MRTLLLLAAVVLLSSCDGIRSMQPDPETPKDLRELRHLALSCLGDVEFTFIERSEHCVAVSESIFEPRAEHCENIRTFACSRHESVESDILLLFNKAIADSLFYHGKSPEIEKAKQDFSGSLIYFNKDLMRELFELCLEQEEQRLEEKGLQRVHSVEVVPLKQDQRCFREGHPKFETEPLT